MKSNPKPGIFKKKLAAPYALVIWLLKEMISLLKVLGSLLIELVNMMVWLVTNIAMAGSKVALTILGLTRGATLGALWILKHLALGLMGYVLGTVVLMKYLLKMLSKGAEGFKELMALVDPWIRAFWSIAALVIAGVTIFESAVVQSIRSTPHPELVYTIFGIAFITCLLAGIELFRFQQEGRMAKQLIAQNLSEREAMVANLKGGDFKPMLTLMVKPIGVTLVEQRELVETELLACEDHAISRLNLATYLGGSLIGIGLVGTFVGLLGALTDLGGVFSALMGSGLGAKDSDPMALFAGMLVKLQEPMKGMATAFVASLYGLLGSLVLGLVIYSVRKTAGETFMLMRDLMRDHSRQLASQAASQSKPKTDSVAQIAHAAEVMNKHQELLQLLLTDLIHSVKRSSTSNPTHQPKHREEV